MRLVLGKGINDLPRGSCSYLDHTGKRRNHLWYQSWLDRLKSAYCPLRKKRHPTYEEVTLCDAWLRLSVYKLWYLDNYKIFTGERTELDKDILVAGNKHYSPEYCRFVPKSLNQLFTNNLIVNCSGKSGVDSVLVHGKYKVRLSVGKYSKYLGLFLTLDAAEKAYNIAKRDYGMSLLIKWKDQIDKDLHDACLERLNTFNF